MKHSVRITTIKVSERRLDNIFNNISQLYLLREELRRLFRDSRTDSLISKTLIDLEKILAMLYSEALRLKLVPLQGIFRRLERTAYELARKLSKKVKVEIKGGDISIDKRAVDMLLDPLVHLIRNAIDHGIELPSERLRKGKPVEGLLKIYATKSSTEIVITIEDDGRGIDIERVKKKALERKLITPDEARKLSWNDIVKILTTPGFSTKDVTSDISGRGIGMDVVKNNVETLGGSLNIISEKDKGTKIALSIPLSSIIIKALVVKIRETFFAIPLSHIYKIVKKTSKTRYIVERKKIIPLINDLNSDNANYVVIVKTQYGEKGLIVDSIVKEGNLLIKSLPLMLRKNTSNIISGIALLSKKEVAFLLNVNKLT